MMTVIMAEITKIPLAYLRYTFPRAIQNWLLRIS